MNTNLAMSNQAFFELSSTLLSPKHVGLNPFPAADDVRLSTAPPRVSSALYNYTMCAKRAINTRIIGFCEPTLQQCVDQLVMEVKASKLGGQDPDSLSEALNRRRNVVDPQTLPWQPKPEYLKWLEDRGRLRVSQSPT